MPQKVSNRLLPTARRSFSGLGREPTWQPGTRRRLPFVTKSLSDDGVEQQFATPQPSQGHLTEMQEKPSAFYDPRTSQRRSPLEKRVACKAETQSGPSFALSFSSNTLTQTL